VLLYVKDPLHPVVHQTDAKYREHVGCRDNSLLIGVCYRSSNKTIVGDDNASKLNKVLQ